MRRRARASPRRSCRSRSGAQPSARGSTTRTPTPDGLDALLDGLNAEQRRAVTHGDGPLLVVAGRRHRQDAGHHPPDRLADRDPAREAVGDPRADVHGQGRGRDAGPGRPARPVRLHGHGDLDVPRVRRPARSASSRSSSGCRRTSGCCRGRRRSCSCASTCSSSSWRSTGRSATRRGSSTPSRRCSRGPRTRTSRPTRTSRTRSGWPCARPSALAAVDAAGDVATEADRDAAAALAEEARRQAELARAYAPLPARSSREHGAIDFGDQVVARAPAAARVAGRARARPGAVPVRPRGRVPGHEPGPVGARRAARASGTATSRSSATTTSRSTSSAAPRSATSSSSASATAARASSSCAGTTGRSRRSSTRPTGSSGTTTRTGSRSGPGSSSGSSPERGRRRRAAGPPRGVRDGRRGGGLDRGGDRAPDPRRAPRPRDIAVLVRANAAADPILRSLNLAGIPWRFSGTSRPVRPAGGPAAARRSCARSRTSARRVDVYALAASDLYGLGGEDLVDDREHRRGAGTGRVCEVLEELERQPGILRLSPETRAARRDARRGPARATSSSPTSGRPARSCTRSCAARAGSRGSPTARHGRGRGGAVEHRALLRHHPRPVGAARRRPGGVRRPPPPDADRGRRRPADRGHRPRRGRGRGDDRPQGEGPRVPGRVPAGPGRRPVPGRSGGASRWPCRVELVNEVAARGRLPAPGGAAAVLRRR